MNEFSDFATLIQSNNNDPTSYCQAWEECAANYYHDSSIYDSSSSSSSSQFDRHLAFDSHPDHLEEKYEGESRGHADDATWILTSSFVIFTMQS
eukprot:CAMPEP_0201664362 /NCGR_PEP_ID=MMETSP0494-20130426/5857_1 /ASSEMBLY_ACC=CAM_ASM_000839 /TAXON_ID=420259 /ORGANISM="Thalassiosira gravida, Strain GMp14c1" /LENGTH=93 /DNA_ID=CAMNT_0048143115 /DNA_START=92 /DNA_END=369 /DNA_ORIENTATION=+